MKPLFQLATVSARQDGLNPADHVLQAGLGDAITDAWFPVISGWDVAGVVERVGAGVTEFAAGDEVAGFAHEEIPRHGTYAEKISASVSPRCYTSRAMRRGREQRGCRWRGSRHIRPSFTR